jgi:hypothetical protein
MHLYEALGGAFAELGANMMLVHEVGDQNDPRRSGEIAFTGCVRGNCRVQSYVAITADDDVWAAMTRPGGDPDELIVFAPKKAGAREPKSLAGWLGKDGPKIERRGLL